MTQLVSYVLKVVLCSGVLYLYYALALKNKVFHQWNRFYLLAAVALSVVLPLVQVAVFNSEEQTDAVRFIKAVQAADDYLENITITAQTHSLDTAQWLLAGYATGSLALLFLLVASLLKIKRLLKAHKVQVFKRIKFVNTREQGTPFSFLRYIFWNEDISLQSDAGRWIFEHELVHVTEKHTADKLFMQVVLSLFWCNPFFWLMRRELSFVHEFIADKKSVGHHGTAAFAAMVLQASFPQHYSSVTNSFFQLSIKRRFAMLTKQNNPKLNYVLRIIALPLLALVIFAFSIRTKEKLERPNFSNAVVTLKNDTIPKAQKKVESVDVNKAKGLLTIYYTDGSCETMTEQEANNRGLINDGGYANAKRRTTKIIASSAELRVKDSTVKPLIVVDGTIVPYSVLSAIDPNKIESINILKDDAATPEYGDRGKNGVIEIKTKNGYGGKISLKADNMTGTFDSLRIVSTDPLNLHANITLDQPTSTTEKAQLKEVTVVGHPLNNEPIFTQTEMPASVDKNEWRAFIENASVPILKNVVNKGAKPGMYTVNVRFLVKKDGSLSNFEALNNPGYDLDKQVLAILPNSPKWKPAEQNGKSVTSYHTQPITFQIQEQ